MSLLERGEREKKHVCCAHRVWFSRFYRQLLTGAGIVIGAGKQSFALLPNLVEGFLS